ncbi:WD repeat-containing protein 25 isoform X2 [Cynara cardunculus var. scolymus]|uniref:WD repeat-containing protein 25 isoform X2 n=1 Tax=Cynara cardunculus var. scolymus TaxID=59895 RepID=UPI000D6250B7|nr:WD repeat-containing protein 25 isoform X2 [Cynara cardunculus var. scolymus]XP_024977308.1 WD repeat-containing protein 25 isoform X2 [Cynara cardunculus var. scolymus]XP_024977310.1 WD repeat-containing protein 25 isoform X2 [Cynara cardunculus var. scolymus]
MPIPLLRMKMKKTKTPIAGRYISKRERALMATVPQTPNADPPTSSGCFHVQGSISDSYIRKDILSSLRNRTEGYANSGHKSEGISTNLIGHSKAVNALQWSKTQSHLLASAGMDSSIYIWNVWSTEQKKARVFNIHTAAVKDVKWSDQGLYLLSCGYDCSSRLIDVEKGVETREFKEDQVVGVVKFHPNNSNLFLSGGSKGIIRLWDIRTGNTVNQYLRGLGPVLDVEFTNDTRQFVSSSDESKSNISENSIIVWDVSRQIPLSNQIYVEAYTCPCIRHHPSEPYFVAQSNGNYIAIFSSKPPFRLDKYKRYESHGVSGFPVKCNFSMDGKKLASGSSDGCIYVYNAKTCELIKKIKAYEQTCIDVAFHTVMSNVIASCSWNGEISVFE